MLPQVNGVYLSHVLASGANIPIDLSQIGFFIQFGLLGIIFVMLISKKFVIPKWTLDTLEDVHAREMAAKELQLATLEKEKDELRRSIDDLQNLTRQQMLPAIIEANRLTALYIETLGKRASVSDHGPV